MLLMRIEVGASDPEVVQVAISKGQARQDSIHYPLETAARVPEPKGHAQIFEEAKLCHHLTGT